MFREAFSVRPSRSGREWTGAKRGGSLNDAKTDEGLADGGDGGARLCVQLIDQDNDGIISEADLRGLLASLGSFRSLRVVLRCRSAFYKLVPFLQASTLLRN